MNHSPFAPYVLAAPHCLAAVLENAVGVGPYTLTAPVISGGTVTISGGYVYHTFNSNGTLYVWQNGSCDILVVGGGGGGGYAGGGAGEHRSFVNFPLTSGVYAITIGAGGAGTAFAGGAGQGSDGSPTILGSLATALGGGGGGGFHTTLYNGRNGGNGGGGGCRDFAPYVPGSAGTGLAGFNGGTGASGATSAGGGGGSGAQGGNGSGTTGGAGGAGTTWLDGVTRAGGGGGSGGGGGVGGAGGSGGGGKGWGATGGGRTSGTANTGSGGGGTATEATGGDGGSGVVIIRYLVSDLLNGLYATGGTVSVDGNLIRHTITASTTFTLASRGSLDITDGVAVGGGGGGGGGQPSTSLGPGGGGGKVQTIAGQTIYVNQTCTIGVGGVAATAHSNTYADRIGGVGGTTSFGSIATAAGGEGGCVDGAAEGGDAGNGVNTGANGGGFPNGGGGGGDAANASGKNGGVGTSWNGAIYGSGGGGGDGGAGGTNAGNAGGTSPVANMGGGGAGLSNSPAGAQQAGAAGVIIVRYAPGAFQPGHPLGLGSDLYQWFDPTVGVTGGATVTQWNDQSGNARHVTPGAAGSPSSGTRQVNGINVVDFDGTNDGLGATSGISLGMTNYTFIQHLGQDDTGVVAGFLNFYANANTHDYDNTNSVTWNSGASGPNRTCGATINMTDLSVLGNQGTPPAIWAVRKNGTAFAIYRDGVSQTLTAATVTATGTADRMSMGWRAKESGNYLNGFIGQTVVASAALSDAELLRTSTWVKVKSGYPGSSHLFTDTFDRSDRSLVSDNGWGPAPSFGSVGIISLVAKSTTASNGIWLSNNNGGVSSTNHYAEADVVAMPVGSIGGVLCRYVDNNNTISFIYDNYSATKQFVLQKRIGTTYTTLATSVEALPSLPFRMRIEIVGTAVVGKVNTGAGWITKGSGTVSDGAVASGKPGLFFQNVTTDPSFDNYAHGNT